MDGPTDRVTYRASCIDKKKGDPYQDGRWIEAVKIPENSMARDAGSISGATSGVISGATSGVRSGRISGKIGGMMCGTICSKVGIIAGVFEANVDTILVG